jgi:Rieske Fe-S protein
MHRKEFIKQCSFACLGVVAASMGFESCSPVKYLQVKAENNQVHILKSEFTEMRNEKPHMRSYLIVKAGNMDYPIVVYRINDNEYTALLMRCTHQGSELNVYGSMLTCPAHGSEFSNKGEVLQGPAEEHLKSYPVSADTTAIHIHLT